MSDISYIWDAALPLIEEEINAVGYKTWIMSMKPLSLTEEPYTAIFSVPNPIVKTMIVKRYNDLIKNVLFEITGITYNIDVRVDGEDTPLEDHPVETKPSAPVFKNTFNPKYTFDTFVVGNSNRFANAAALAVAEAPGITYNPLFLYGGVGLGKTHLLHAIGNHIFSNNPSAKVLYTTSETFTNELINSIKDKKTTEFRNKYRSLDVLMIDDIQFIAGKKLTEEEFFHTFNSLYEEKKQIVITSDRPPKEIKVLEERIKSRCEWGLLGDLYSPDFETRVAILRQKSQNDGSSIDDEILMFIAEKITTNIRELEGVYNRVVAYRSLVGENITMDIVADMIKVYEDNSHKFVNEKTILNSCSEYFGISVDDIMSDKRPKEIVEARQTSMYLMREILGLSYLKIGKFMGRDHSTVMAAIKKVEYELKNNPGLSDSMDSLIHDIKG